MNLENANENDLPVWEKLYSAKEAYNMTSLAPQDWHDLYQRLLADDDLFDTYYRYAVYVSRWETPGGEGHKN